MLNCFEKLYFFNFIFFCFWEFFCFTIDFRVFFKNVNLEFLIWGYFYFKENKRWLLIKFEFDNFDNEINLMNFLF